MIICQIQKVKIWINNFRDYVNESSPHETQHSPPHHQSPPCSPLVHSGPPQPRPLHHRASHLTHCRHWRYHWHESCAYCCCCCLCCCVECWVWSGRAVAGCLVTEDVNDTIPLVMPIEVIYRSIHWHLVGQYSVSSVSSHCMCLCTSSTFHKSVCCSHSVKPRNSLFLVTAIW